MPLLPGIYRAKAVSISGAQVMAFIPQVFGDQSVLISQFAGGMPAPPEMGWVTFLGAMADYPVWMGTSTGNGDAGGGTSFSQFHYRWKTQTTAADPGHGYVKGNAAPASATTLYLSLYDGSNQAVPVLQQLVTGDRIVLYESGDIHKYIIYTLGTPLTLTGVGWGSGPVTAENHGFAPTNNAEILLVVSTPGGGGGGTVTDTLWVGASAPTNPSIELWYDTDEPTPPTMGVLAEHLLGLGPSGIFAVSSTASTFFTLNATTVSGRRYRATLSVRALDVVTVNTYMVFTLTGPGVVASQNDHYILVGLASTGYSGGAAMCWFFNGTGTAGTYTMTVSSQAATGHIHNQQGPASRFIIEDIGPV